ncbi:MAG: hypothetical protein HZC28_07995 [Spirochaetes bacterium]|nr:hypothetical protein [Spirochaetota bacterium]
MGYRSLLIYVVMCISGAASFATDAPPDDMLSITDQPSSNMPQVLPPPSPMMQSNGIIIAYYGSPNSKRMGILGRYTKEDLLPVIRAQTAMYESNIISNSVRGAFYIIYGVCTAGGNITTLPQHTMRSYIEYAQSNGLLVYVDHQIGRFSIGYAMRSIMPFLQYDNVHLALDPEWRTSRPLEEIGSVSSEELNIAQTMMQGYMISNNISGKRQLVVHQFHKKMITARYMVRSDNEQVMLVHATSGIGPPAAKKMTHTYNAYATNMPFKAFKLWFPSSTTDQKCDKPIMSPCDVLSLTPQPMLIIYQ